MRVIREDGAEGARVTELGRAKHDGHSGDGGKRDNPEVERGWACHITDAPSDALALPLALSGLLHTWAYRRMATS